MTEKKEIAKLSDIDKRILNALITDGSMSYAALGTLLGMSSTGAHERVRKLKEQGVIERISAVVSPEKVDRNFLCFVQLKLADVDKAGKAEQLGRIVEIEEIHNIAGEYSLMCKIRARNTDHMEKVFTRIYAIEGITQSVTTVVFSTFLEKPMRLDIESD